MKLIWYCSLLSLFFSISCKPGKTPKDPDAGSTIYPFAAGNSITGIDGYLAHNNTSDISISTPELKQRAEIKLVELNRQNAEKMKEEQNTVENKILTVVKKKEKIDFEVYILCLKIFEIYHEETNDNEMRKQFIEKFNSLSIHEREKRLRRGTALCDEGTGLMNPGFAHLTDAERTELFFKKVDLLNLD